MNEQAIRNHISACRAKIAQYEREIKEWRVYGLRHPENRQRATAEILCCQSLIEREQKAIDRHMGKAGDNGRVPTAFP